LRQAQVETGADENQAISILCGGRGVNPGRAL